MRAGNAEVLYIEIDSPVEAIEQSDIDKLRAYIVNVTKDIKPTDVIIEVFSGSCIIRVTISRDDEVRLLSSCQAHASCHGKHMQVMNVR